MPGFVAELPTPTRLFTVEQANALLPDILPVVASLREHALALRAEQAVLDELARRADEMGGVQPTAREAEAAVHACEHLSALDDAIGELQGAGVRVKDAERGLLDFPSERDGELIELCWLYGEHAVTHWHRIGEGYAQRRQRRRRRRPPRAISRDRSLAPAVAGGVVRADAVDLELSQARDLRRAGRPSRPRSRSPAACRRCTSSRLTSSRWQDTTCAS